MNTGHACSAAAAALLVTVLCSCSSAPPAQRAGSSVDGQLLVTQPELTERVGELAERFSGTIQMAAERIQRSTNDPKIRRRTVIWQSESIQQANEAAFQADPREGFLDLAAYILQLRDFFATGDGRVYFNEWTSIAVEAVESLAGDARTIAKSIVPEAMQDSLGTAVNEFAEKHPLRGTGFRRVELASNVVAKEGGPLARILAVPLSPFRALAGVDRAAASIDDFVQVADRMSVYVEQMPDQLRWQTELLLWDVQDMQVFVTLEESAAKVANSATEIAQSATSFGETAGRAVDTVERAIDTAERLPATVRGELVTAVEEVESRQAGLRETMSTMRATIDDLDAVLAAADRTSTTLTGTGEAWEATVRATQQLMDAFKTDGADGARTSDAKPFDIDDYTRALEQAEAATVELQRLLSQTNDLSAAGQLLDRLQVSLDATTRSVTGLTNAITVRIVLLIIVFFAAALGYKMLVTRLTRPRHA